MQPTKPPTIEDIVSILEFCLLYFAESQHAMSCYPKGLVRECLDHMWVATRQGDVSISPWWNSNAWSMAYKSLVEEDGSLGLHPRTLEALPSLWTRPSGQPLTVSWLLAKYRRQRQYIRLLESDWLLDKQYFKNFSQKSQSLNTWLFNCFHAFGSRSFPIPVSKNASNTSSWRKTNKSEQHRWQITVSLPSVLSCWSWH